MMTDIFKFNLEHDWIFQDPIDFEYKKYVLLAYLKKIDELIGQNKIYPSFIEISLQLASLQTLIKENIILYTNKKFTSFDDEVLLKELIATPAPKVNEQDKEEIEKVIKYSAKKFYEYFSIFKGYWQLVFETISFSVKRNKKYIESENGYIVYHLKSSNQIFVWEYHLKDSEVIVDDQNINVNLIYDGDKKGLTLNQIINNFSSFSESQKKKTPVVEFKSEKEYPINETLLPLFKRKLVSHIYQSKKFKNIPTIDA
jgi:hypothetical protein